MSSALNARADTSAQSSVTVPDISLGSLNSTFSTPARKLRIPSTSTGTTAVSPPSGYFAKRRAEEATPKRVGHDDDDGEDHDGDVLDTPDGRKERWGDDSATPAKPKRSRSKGKGGVNLTLRDQEKVCPTARSAFGRRARMRRLEVISAETFRTACI